jgi:methylated-DNA-[protein]-cysteine S-methyltransferase
MSVHLCHYQSPCGELLLGSYEGRICLCDWAARKNRATIDKRLRLSLKAEYVEQKDDVIVLLSRQLDEYFRRERRTFDVPLIMAGTPFQQHVWCQLMCIPYGQMVSYAEMAERIGVSTSVRAVANAIGANVLSIIIPCHRVVGSNGSLTGYAGGIPAKRYLLELEKG